MVRAALLLALAALAVLPAPASAGPKTHCGYQGYSYAGLGGVAKATGVAATIKLHALPRVQAGHVAAWVGLGGHGAGPNGTSAWIQAGIITKTGLPPSLYYEYTKPGAEPELVVVGRALPGRKYRISVRETAADVWRVEVNGRAVARSVRLPGSHARWEPTATTESWDDNVRVCNRFDVAFDGVESRHARTWRPFGSGVTFSAPGFKLAKRTASSFRAIA